MLDWWSMASVRVCVVIKTHLELFEVLSLFVTQSTIKLNLFQRFGFFGMTRKKFQLNQPEIFSAAIRVVTSIEFTQTAGAVNRRNECQIHCQGWPNRRRRLFDHQFESLIVEPKPRQRSLATRDQTPQPQVRLIRASIGMCLLLCDFYVNFYVTWNSESSKP